MADETGNLKKKNHFNTYTYTYSFRISCFVFPFREEVLKISTRVVEYCFPVGWSKIPGVHGLLTCTCVIVMRCPLVCVVDMGNRYGPCCNTEYGNTRIMYYSSIPTISMYTKHKTGRKSEHCSVVYINITHNVWSIATQWAVIQKTAYLYIILHNRYQLNMS
jgi:hypothetical protein